MNLAGCVPGDYSSKLNLSLNHEASGREATCEILKCLQDVMHQNEAGIRADWDTEFLHDFRVAIRRTRSALSQIKGVLPEDAVAHFKDEFRQLGRSTNRFARSRCVFARGRDLSRDVAPVAATRAGCRVFRA